MAASTSVPSFRIDALGVRFFRVPRGSRAANHRLAVLVDTSGSMSSVWPKVADGINRIVAAHDGPGASATSTLIVAFDHGTRDVQANKPLQTRIGEYGGGSTDISTGFKRFAERLSERDSEIPTTALFISDGQDTTGIVSV